MSAVTSGAATSACANDGQWVSAFKVVGAMTCDWVEMDTISCSAVVSSCEKGGQWQRALDFHGCAKQSNAEKNIISYNSMILGLLSAKQWKRILSLFDDMPEYRVDPDIDTHNMVFMECEQRCLVRRDVEFLRGFCGLEGPDELSLSNADYIGGVNDVSGWADMSLSGRQ